MQEIVSTASRINYQSMLCSQKNQAQFLCSTYGCKSCAMVCGKRKCKCMIEQHPNCDITMVDNVLERILAKNQPLGKELEKTVKMIQQIYQKSIDKLSQELQSIRVWKDNFGLSVDQAKLINLIKLNDQIQLTGDLVNKVKVKIAEKQDFSGLNAQYVELIWKRQQPKYEKVFQKMMNMVKIPPKAGKFQFQWDQQTKRANIKINEKCISSTQNEGNVVAFMNPDFKMISSSKPIKWAIKLKELSGYDGSVGVGICFRNKFLNSGMSLESTQLRSLGNGIYLAMSSGYSLSHSSQQQNFDRSTMNFKENDILNVCFDQENKILKIVKNNNVQKMITLNGVQDPPEGDFYSPCIAISGKHTVAQIVQPNEYIQWDSVKAENGKDQNVQMNNRVGRLGSGKYSNYDQQQ